MNTSGIYQHTFYRQLNEELFDRELRNQPTSTAIGPSALHSKIGHNKFSDRLHHQSIALVTGVSLVLFGFMALTLTGLDGTALLKTAIVFQTFVMLAIALNIEATGFLLTAVFNLVVSVYGLYSIQAYGYEVLPVFMAQLFFVGLAAMDNKASGITVTAWKYASLTVLGLVIVGGV